MKTLFKTQRILQTAFGLLAMALTVGESRASTNVFDFDSDPFGILNVTATGDNPEAAALAGQWFPTNGSTLEVVADPSTNGYLAITQGDTNNPAGHGHRAVIIFDDFDVGTVVAGFTFTCDLRVGAGSDVPADGFSLNYARGDDPVLTGGAFAPSPGGEANLPEEGTQTGLAICFDAWDSGSGDVIGLTVKVDAGAVGGAGIITNVPLPTANGACDDPTSAQTGPNTNGVEGLCWQPLFVQLTTDGLLSVSWKGEPFLTNFFVPFNPSPGRLVFAGRVGGNNQHTHVDNIRIVTIPSANPIVGGSVGNANGFKFSITDSGFATPDTNTLTVTLDGAAVSPSVLTQDFSSGFGITTFAYQDTNLVLAPGSEHTNVIHFTGSTFSGAVDQTNTFVVPDYIVLTDADQAPGTVNTSLTGFAGRISELPVARYPNPNSIAGIERQLADGYIDPSTMMPYVSLTSVSDFTDDDVINWGQDVAIGGADVGFFQIFNPSPANVADEAIPGTDRASHDPNNIAAELVTILDLSVGTYRLGVNADDSFKLTAGAEPRDQFAKLLTSREGNGSRTVDIVVTNAGMYPIRIAYGENGGGAGLEVYLVDFLTENRILINDQVHEGSVNAYRDTSALTQPYVKSYSPVANQTLLQDGSIVVTFEDGSGGTVTDGSISINGQTPTIANNGGETTATLTGGFPVGLNTATLVYSTSSGGPFTNTWTFDVYSSLADVTIPGDPITTYQPEGGSSPNNESVTNVIANITQKYLNFGTNGAPIPPVGFDVTPSTGPTVVTGMRLYPANDAPERDPAHIILQGSYNAGATWNTIFEGDVTLPDGRNPGSANFGTTNVVNIAIDPSQQFVREVQFSNSTGYSSYRWYTTQLKGNPSLMQIAEVELLGVAGTLPPLLSVSLVDGQVVITANQEGTLEVTTDFSGWSEVGPIGPTSGPVMVSPTGFDPQLYRLRIP